jgi:hypothetical protein
MVENQAIGRVLRLGQKRNVKVVRYMIVGTVEEVTSIFCSWRQYMLMRIS